MAKPKFYQSMAHCAGAEGISIDVLRAAKRAGCPHFVGSRVRRAGLKKWIGDHGHEIAASKGGLREEKTAEEIRKLKLRNDLFERKLIPRAEVASHLIATFGPALSRVEQLLCNEYPLVVAGLDVPQARIKGRAIYDLL